MSTRTGVDFTLFGGVSGSASSAQVNAALDAAWDWLEDELQTNIYIATETNEEHLYPYVMSDWNRSDDRVTLLKTHVVSVTTVTIRQNIGCNCDITTVDGCALIVDAPPSIIAIRGSLNTYLANCATCTGSIKPFNVHITYTAGLFALGTALPAAIQQAVVMKAKEILLQITTVDVSGLGAQDITSWRSMDYSETRRAAMGASNLDDYIRKTFLKKYLVKRAFSLRRTT